MTTLEFPSDWAHVWSDPKPACGGLYRLEPADFRVDEVLGFDPSGEGEHVYLHIEKVGQNTQWVMDELARQLGIKRKLFGHSGIKDRHAIATQWISFQDPTRAADFEKLEIPGVRLLDTNSHTKKLRPGMHQENRFELRLHELTSKADNLAPLLDVVSKNGFPNYFGEQRFGHDGGNLASGWKLLESRRLKEHKKKSIYLSALRSFLFNQVLNQRIRKNLVQELDELDSTGPLWGRGRAKVSEYQQAFERKMVSDWQPLCDALEYSGLTQERRALMVIPANMHWEWESKDTLRLEFSLPPGSYATSLIRELGDFTDASKRAE